MGIGHVVNELKQCRICGNRTLVPFLYLGSQYLTGVFPGRPTHDLTQGPLELVKCHREGDEDHCGLVQLRHSYDPAELYGGNYGYRSSLNRSMVDHLRGIVEELLRITSPGPGDLVVDIGSNDGTLLSFYPDTGATLLGVDPTAGKFARFYPPRVRVIPDFFAADRLRAEVGDRKAKIVTSIAMFYDLDAPTDFMREVRGILAPEGVWHLEQSYLPSLLSATAYDTVCHEHLEYYALRQIQHMSERSGLKIIGVSLTEVNGGSFAVTLARADAPYPEATATLGALLDAEDRLGLRSMVPYHAFARRVESHRAELLECLHHLSRDGHTVLGYGASTKGNVILQYCGLTVRDLPCIAEVNEDKFGRFTPGSGIPIVSEADARALRPTHYLVLPWHFRDNLLKRESAFLRAGGRMIFPLPRIDIVGA